MGGGGGGGDGEPEFQIAPMIDVLLVLLVFFVMITSAEVLKVDKELKLPVSKNANKKDPEMARHEVAVNVRLDKGPNKGILIMDDKTYTSWEELIPVLKAMKEKDDKIRVVMRGDAALPAGEVQRVMNLIGEAGISDIAFAASNK